MSPATSKNQIMDTKCRKRCLVLRDFSARTPFFWDFIRSTPLVPSACSIMVFLSRTKKDLKRELRAYSLHNTLATLLYPEQTKYSNIQPHPTPKNLRAMFHDIVVPRLPTAPEKESKSWRPSTGLNGPCSIAR